MATAKNKFREKSVEETVIEKNTVDKNDIEETITSNTKNKPKGLKNDSQRKVESKKEIAEPTLSYKERWKKGVEIYQNERTQKLVGLLLILAGIYILIACVSYIFTWEQDQDKVFAPLSQ